MFGFLNVYKPKGMTSHDVVDALRKVTRIKQIGHTGTLDPFAQGVLPVAIGKATRLIEFLDDGKEYLAEITFGHSTTTFDIEGDAIFSAQEGTVKKISKDQLEEALKDFRGEILQTPPIYSALKVKGKKLYEYARAGEEVKIEPRKVTIEKIEIKNFDEEKQIAEVLIKCSKGTYIRSIANDLGQNLGCGAFLSKLIRTQAGKFLVDSATKLEDFISSSDVEEKLVNPVDVLNLKYKEITEDEHKKVLVGQSISNSESFNDGENIILCFNGQVSAIAKVREKEILAKKVFI